MNTKNFLLSSITIPILAMGIGCMLENQDIQTYSQKNNSQTIYTSFNKTNQHDLKHISFIIEPGVQTVQIEHGPPIITTEKYGLAHILYEKSGTRFGFTDCTGNLKSLITKPNISFMIDNRDNESHTIGINSAIYTLAPYDFAIVKIDTPGDFLITCDEIEVAYVKIQN